MAQILSVTWSIEWLHHNNPKTYTYPFQIKGFVHYIHTYCIFVCIFFFYVCKICKRMCVEDTQEIQQSRLSFCITSTNLKRAWIRNLQDIQNCSIQNEVPLESVFLKRQVLINVLLSPPGHRGRSYRWLPCCFGAKSLCAAQEGISCADTAWRHC